MPSNQTANYQLSQWVKSDQVKMDDFNADNAKLDAALVDLGQSAKLQEIRTVVTTAASNFVTVPLVPDWSDWKRVHVDIIPAAGTHENMYACVNKGFMDQIVKISPKWTHLVLCPCGSAETLITVLCYTETFSYYRIAAPFSRMTELSIIGENGNWRMAVGSKIIIRGEHV